MVQDFFWSRDQNDIWQNLSDFGYNYTYLNINYPYWYETEHIISTKWEFTNSTFMVSKIKYEYTLYAFKNPKNLSNFIKNFFLLIKEVNNDPIVKFAKLNIFSNYTFEDFFIFLMLNAFVILVPYEEYLSILIDDLSLNNTSIERSTLIMELMGNNIYFIEISYGENGMCSQFVVKGSNNEIFYEIIVVETEWIVFVILIIISSGIGTIIAFSIYKRLKRIKKFKSQKKSFNL